MPLTRCPRCAHRQVVAPEVVGELIGCPRCELNFKAQILTKAGQLGEMVMVGAALATAAVVAWLLLRGGT